MNNPNENIFDNLKNVLLKESEKKINEFKDTV